MREESPILICSFHDLHPGSLPACERFIQGLADRGINRASLLVVPRWHGGAAFTDNTEFVSWLRLRAAEGHDLCMHGFYHRADAVKGGARAQLTGRVYTAGEGEYFQITREIARERLAAGLQLFLDAGIPIYGFTPPAWLLSGEGRSVLREVGFHYNTTFRYVELLQANRSLPAPTVVLSSRSRFRRFASRVWCPLWLVANRRQPILRLAAHPIDFAFPDTEMLLWRLVDAAARGREFRTYRDLAGPTIEPLKRSA